MLHQLNALNFRKFEHHCLVSDSDVVEVQQVHHRPFETVLCGVVSERHVKLPDYLSLFLISEAPLLELNELPCFVAHD